jgi:hypothetical protein
MEEILQKSFVAGLERLVARAELLDSINVFPVADGDTGRNLSISLIPLRNIDKPKEKIIHRLLLSARGNSGNIASQFFSSFCAAENIVDLAQRAKEGTVKAWKALNNPRPGTMLSVFDALMDVLPPDFNPGQQTVENIISRLEKSVHETHEQLPRLKEAGVVDAGALGMYIFFEGFFNTLADIPDACRPVMETFKDRLKISSSFQENSASGYCVDFVVSAPRYSPDEMKTITSAQEEVIIIPEGDLYKIHLHTRDKEQVRSQIAGLGKVLNWEDDNLAAQIEAFRNCGTGALHIMTDAAGSLTVQDAKCYGFTLLNSYLTIGEKCLPETYFHPEELYQAMTNGVKASTSQASVYERHQFYESVLERFEKVLYLCVGSVFTGNYETAIQWKKEHDKDNRLQVIDTGAASGRLGTMALATVRYLAETNSMEKTFAFAKKAVQECEEYVFLDKLQYLAAGGRLSKTSAFFGDMLKMKPVVSPQPEGAKKVGVVRNQKDQVKMALEKLSASLKSDSKALIMLEYSDNKKWLEGTFKPMVAERYPNAEIILQPLSLTSGAHMGPGTWAVAFLPCEKSETGG